MGLIYALGEISICVGFCMCFSFFIPFLFSFSKFCVFVNWFLGWLVVYVFFLFFFFLFVCLFVFFVSFCIWCIYLLVFSSFINFWNFFCSFFCCENLGVCLFSISLGGINWNGENVDWDIFENWIPRYLNFGINWVVNKIWHRCLLNKKRMTLMWLVVLVVPPPLIYKLDIVDFVLLFLFIIIYMTSRGINSYPNSFAITIWTSSNPIVMFVFVKFFIFQMFIYICDTSWSLCMFCLLSFIYFVIWYLWFFIFHYILFMCFSFLIYINILIFVCLYSCLVIYVYVLFFSLCVLSFGVLFLFLFVGSFCLQVIIDEWIGVEISILVLLGLLVVGNCIEQEMGNLEQYILNIIICQQNYNYSLMKSGYAFQRN